VTAPNGTGTKNHGHQKCQVTIRDIRGREDCFNVDDHSFAALQVPDLKSMDVSNDESIEAQYYPLIERVLRQHFHAEGIFIFDHCIRRISSDKSIQSPVRKVHIDQTPFSAEMRLKRHVPESVQQSIAANNKRVRLINVWRPIRRQVTDHPLTFAESASVADEDLVEVAHIFDDRVGETFAVKYNEKQKFWYWSNMQVDEILLLQCSDNAKSVDGRSASRCAHASFELPGSVTNERESIEVRCLVVGG